MILEDHERQKFAAYLEQDADSHEALVSQFDKLSMPPVVKEQLMKQKRTLAIAERIVAKMLRETQSQTIGR